MPSTPDRSAPPLVVAMVPNHAPFGRDWAEAVGDRARMVTLEIVRSLTLPEVAPGLGAQGDDYQVLRIALRPSRLMLPVSARIQARRVDAALTRIAADHGPIDLLHTHYYHNTRILRHLRNRPPYVHTEHSAALVADDLGAAAHHRLSATGRRMAQRGYADAARVIAVSDYLRRCLTPLFHGPYAVIPNPVDCAVFAPSPERDEHLVMAVGRISPEKRPSLLLEAFALAAARHRDLELEWVGDGRELAAAQARAAELGIADRVRFPGRLPRDELASRLGRARLFLHASLSETFGVAIAEALAAGVPVVAPDVGAVGELVGDRNGALVADTGADALAAGIERVLAGTFDRAAISAEVAARCSYPAVGAQIADIYAEVLGSIPA